jgi:hypothetical protein
MIDFLWKFRLISSRYFATRITTTVMRKFRLQWIKQNGL